MRVNTGFLSTPPTGIPVKSPMAHRVMGKAFRILLLCSSILTQPLSLEHLHFNLGFFTHLLVNRGINNVPQPSAGQSSGNAMMLRIFILSMNCTPGRVYGAGYIREVKSSTATFTMEAGCSFCLFGPIVPLEWEEKATGARAEKGLTLRKGKHPLGISSSIVIVETRLFPLS